MTTQYQYQCPQKQSQSHQQQSQSQSHQRQTLANYQAFEKAIAYEKQQIFVKILLEQHEQSSTKNKQSPDVDVNFNVNVNVNVNVNNNNDNDNKNSESLSLPNQLDGQFIKEKQLMAQQVFTIHQQVKAVIKELKQKMQTRSNLENYAIREIAAIQLQDDLNKLNQIQKSLAEKQSLHENIYAVLEDFLTEHQILQKRTKYSNNLDQLLQKLQEFKNKINQIYSQELKEINKYQELVNQSCDNMKERIKNVQNQNKKVQEMVQQSKLHENRLSQEEEGLYKQLRKATVDKNGRQKEKTSNIKKGSNSQNLSNLSELDDAQSYYKKNKNNQSVISSVISQGELINTKRYQQPISSIISEQKPLIQVINNQSVDTLHDQYKNHKRQWHILAFFMLLSLIILSSA